MRLAALATLASLASSLSSGCTGGPGPDAGIAQRRPAPAARRGPSTFELDPQRVLDDVELLASDDFRGRAAGTPGNEAALDYVESVFVDLGLTPAGDAGGYRQRFAFTEPSRHAPDAELILGGAPLARWAEYDVPEYSGAGTASGEVVLAGYGITVPPFSREAFPECPLDPERGYDDYAGVDVRGRIVVVARHGPGGDIRVYQRCPASAACLTWPCNWDYGYKAANARLHGAIAVIVVENLRQAPELPRRVTLQSVYFAAGFLALVSRRAALEPALPELAPRLAAIDAALAPSSAATGVIASAWVDDADEVVEVENVLGAIDGIDPAIGDEVVVVGAHVDHVAERSDGRIFNGADDNASGTAVMLELARAFAGSGVAPARTLLFAAWNAEEEGLWGSCVYTASPSFPLERTVAAFSIDMVGGGSGDGIVLEGATAPGSTWIAEVMERSARERGLEHSIEAAPLHYYSDHRCFVSRGVPGVLAITPGDRPLYHTPSDDPRHLHPGDLKAAARLLLAGLLPLADGTVRVPSMADVP
jgi:hypothetical protein